MKLLLKCVIILSNAFVFASVKPGWGEWAGIGLSGISEKAKASRERQIKKIDEESAEKRALRKDGKIFNVVLSDRRVKTAAKYKIGEVPHPFTTREEYERSIQMPLGGEILSSVSINFMYNLFNCSQRNGMHLTL